MIPQGFIQELLSRVDIVDVVGRAVALRKAGANFMGLCPFHGEKSPSFSVSPTKQFFHCFGCGAHGSAIGFLMDHQGLAYVEAIEELARSVGLVVPHEQGKSDAPRRDPDLLELMSTAARYYRQRLRESDRAIDYLRGRGLSGETAARYGIGYAPDGWRNLQAAVPDYASPMLPEAGLVIDADPDEEGGLRKRYDRFRDRIMFPIRNGRGQIIGFGGRVLDRGEPKYLNSPETPLFSKGRELYGLFEAREGMRRTDCAVVVEGYMDVVMLAQHGVDHAVATLGTATTGDHVRLLLRQVDRVVFSFDGDAAGRKAAWRALEACLPQVSDTKRIDFLFLPPEHDPDSFVREHGARGFADKLQEALPLSRFLLQELSQRADPQGPEGRARLLALARPLIQSMPPIALRLQLGHEVATLAQVQRSEFERYMAQGQSTPRADRPAGPDRSRESEWVPPERGARGAWTGKGGRGSDARSGTGRGGPAQSRAWSGAARAGRTSALLPDLASRIRLISALHPAVVHEDYDSEFLPEELLGWMAWLRGLPPGSNLAAVCEVLRQSDPDLARSLQEAAAEDRSLAADLSLAEARLEFEGALGKLRHRAVREALDALSAGGLREEADRLRYRALMEKLRQA